MSLRIPKIATALTMTALLAIGGCGSSEGDGSAPEATTAATTATPETEATTEAPPTKTPAAEPRTASCELEGSNAKATMEDNADNVVVTFEGEPIAATDTTGYYVTVFDEAGENGGQIGAQYLDGDLIAYFTAVETDGGQTNLTGKPDVSGDTIVMTFPKSKGGLGDIDIAKWSAAFTLAGTDEGLCPADYSTQPFPS